MRATLTASRILVLPRKSKFGLCRNSMAPLNAESGRLALAQDPLEDEAADEIGREDVRDEAHDQGNREALHRPRAELEEEGGGDEGGVVRVEDRDPHPVEAVVDGGLDRLAVAQLLTDALEHEHVRVHAHADGQDD